MLNRIKRLWKLSGESDIVVIKEGAMSVTSAEHLAKMTGKVVVVAKDPNDVRLLKRTEAAGTDGDGKAEFFGEPTPEDEEKFEQESKGMRGWYDRLRNL